MELVDSGSTTDSMLQNGGNSPLLSPRLFAILLFSWCKALLFLLMVASSLPRWPFQLQGTEVKPIKDISEPKIVLSSQTHPSLPCKVFAVICLHSHPWLSKV